MKNTVPYLQDGETSLLVHMRDGDGKLFSNAELARDVSSRFICIYFFGEFN
jgi:hypothetical protein